MTIDVPATPSPRAQHPHRFLPRLGAQIMQALEKARASFTQLDIIWLDAPSGHPVYARQPAPSGGGGVHLATWATPLP